MKRLISDILKSLGIEYFSILAYNDQRETNKSIIERADFTPKSVIVFLLPYYSGETVNLSRYASSLDYHIALREITDSIIEELKDKYPEYSFCGYGDHSPIDERYAALIGGLGIAGDSGLLINEKYGTYVFIGDIITDIPPEAIGAMTPKPIVCCDHCGSCKRACPTGILAGTGTDCLSAITQRKGELSESEADLMRKYNTVWGCDICQISCPYNKDPKITPVGFFHKERIPLLTSEILSSMDKEAFRLRAFAWRGRKTVERNLKLLKY